MDIEALRQELKECVALMRAIADTEPPPGADLSQAECDRFDRAEARADEIKKQLDEIEKRGRVIMSRAGNGLHGDDRGTFNVNRSAADAWDADSVRLSDTAADLRARVETGLERDDTTPDDLKVGAMSTLRTLVGDRRSVALRCLLTGSPSYRSAFAKLAAGQQSLWSDTERTAIARAQSLTDASGGYAVPFVLDPTVVLTNSSAVNPLRRISRTVSTTSDSWNGVTSAGATASWDAEAAEVSDDSITLAQPSIPVFKAACFLPFSIEVGQDWASIESDLRMVIVDSKDRLEATAMLTGTGSGQPTGIITELAGGASEVAEASSEAFTLADVYALQSALPARARMGSPTWMASIDTANKIRQFDTAGGAGLWDTLAAGTPPSLLGWQFAEHSEMDDASSINAAATANNYILLCGDFQKYLIVDRVGLQIELVPHLLHTANNRPSGQRGLYAFWRVGAESIDDNSFRLLNVSTSA